MIPQGHWISMRQLNQPAGTVFFATRASELGSVVVREQCTSPHNVRTTAEGPGQVSRLQTGHFSIFKRPLGCRNQTAPDVSNRHQLRLTSAITTDATVLFPATAFLSQTTAAPFSVSFTLRFSLHRSLVRQTGVSNKIVLKTFCIYLMV
jgi:hypothetical protein